jgi:hypothetical protein
LALDILAITSGFYLDDAGSILLKAEAGTGVVDHRELKKIFSPLTNTHG